MCGSGYRTTFLPRGGLVDLFTVFITLVVDLRIMQDKLPIYHDLEGVRTPLEFVEIIFHDVEGYLGRLKRTEERARRFLAQLGGTEISGLKLPDMAAPQWRTSVSACSSPGCVRRNIAAYEGDQALAPFTQTPQGRARSRAVHHLAGDSFRVHVSFSQFSTRQSLDELIEPFMHTLDDLTPDYQARMAWLSPQTLLADGLVNRLDKGAHKGGRLAHHHSAPQGQAG